MSTLLLRLAGPLQAWGLDDKFKRRGTGREPTKSGVVGLLAAALGRKREESITDLAALRFGIRADQPGTILRDFHMAHGEGGRFGFDSVRFYLTDAKFLVGMEGEDTLLQELDAAVNSPVFPLYLGRRSCPPEGRVSLGVRKKPLCQALKDEPLLGGEGKEVCRTFLMDSENPTEVRRRDLPLSFSQAWRKHGYRYVRIEHDAFGELEEWDNDTIQDPT